MTVTDAQPINGHKVNGHPFKLAAIPQFGQSVPLAEQTQSLPPLAGPDTTPAPAPPAPAQPELSEQDEPDAPPEPVEPDEDTYEVTFPLRKAKDVGFAMSILLAALGQVLFFRELFIGWFGHPALSTIGALGIAACFEVGMIGAGDEAMHKRARNVGSWKLLLATSAFVAVVAVTVQTLHWMPNVGLSVTFGFASMIGWIIHMVSGWVRANGYRQAVTRYTADKAERDHYLRAIRDRKLAAWETRQEAARRAVEYVATPKPEPEPPAKTPAARNAPAKPRSTSNKTAKAAVAKKSDAVRVGVAEQARTPRVLRAALEHAGYTMPASTSTVENWCREIKRQLDQ